MKIIVTLILVLLTLALGYLYSVDSAIVPENKTVSTGDTAVAAVNDVMCTSTACMKKVDEQPVSKDIVVVDSEVRAETLPAEKTSLKEVAVETIKKVIPNPVATPVAPAATIKKYTEFVNPSGYVNSEPFLLADYIGKKIIVLEFITYSCINCQRTFPYMQQWHTKYEKDGVLVVGIHTPEFAYERDRDNVIAAMKKEGITFPIVQDNDYATWNAYANRFWPHRYIIGYNGDVVFDHIGEGAYVETEKVIQLLLANKP